MKLREEVSRGMSFFLCSGTCSPWATLHTQDWLLQDAGWGGRCLNHCLSRVSSFILTTWPQPTSRWAQSYTESKGSRETRICDLTLVFPVDCEREKRKMGALIWGVLQSLISVITDISLSYFTWSKKPTGRMDMYAHSSGPSPSPGLS